MSVRIGPLEVADAERCAELETVLFPADDPWGPAVFRAELAAGCHYLAARADGVLVGYGGIAVAGPEAEIHNLGVDPAEQGAGIGRMLLRGLLALADAGRAVTFLEVRTDNEAALSLYRGEGFEVLRRRKRYYRPSGADAYTMRREPR